MEDLVADGARLVDASSGTVLTGPTLWHAIDQAAEEIGTAGSGLVLLVAPWRLSSILRYLAALTVHRPVALLDPATSPEHLDDLVQRFAPAAVWGSGDLTDPHHTVPSGYEPTATAWIRRCDGPPTHPDLAVLLTTSGSTGTARLVRLSRNAIIANAEAIRQALRLTGAELAPTTMPFFHGYGLSVLNSHLRAGAAVLITDANLMSDTFWGLVDQHGATSFAAVAHLYELLYQLHWNPAHHTSLRTLTQSGGRLRAEIKATLATDIGTNGGGLYVMYGQTEATARLAVLPPEQVFLRPESVGLAVPGSRLTIDGRTAASDGATGEVVFHGPSVMMGYADTAEDLARPDEHHGVLHTGDLGAFDADGYLYLHGRVNRIAKVQGVRVNLDHVESLAGRAHAGPVAAVAGDDLVTMWCQGPMTDEQAAAVARYVAEQLHLNRRGFRARAIDRLPTLSNNKIDYRFLSGVS